MGLGAFSQRSYQRVGAVWRRGLSLRRTLLLVVFLGVVSPAVVMVAI